MANPFLFMEEEVSASVNETVNDAFQNPFLVEDDDDEVSDFPSENPFSASNPFAFNDTENDSGVANNADSSGANFFLAEDDDDEEEELQIHDHEVDPTMSFFGTTINENDIEHDEDMKSVPPPRPLPATQQMISNLTEHLDQTSTNLLGKLPVTRSPSPVSMRDLHSPDDLVDVSDAFAAADEQNHEFIQENKPPSRPPPPSRPLPPRPTPPKTVSTPVQPVNSVTVAQSNTHQQEDDLFDMFGTGHKKPPPKPPAPKSNQDILNLFQTPTTQPAEETKAPDLLSDDFDFSMQQQQPQPQQPQASNVAVVQPYVNEQTETPQAIAIVEPIILQQEVELPVENHVATTPNNQNVPIITEDLAEDRPQSDFMDPPEDEETATQIKSAEQSPTEKTDIPASASGNELNMDIQEMEVDPPQNEIVFEEANPFAEAVVTPQNEQLHFLTQKTTDYQQQKPTTPDPIVSQPELAPIFNIEPISQPVVASQIKPAKPPPPPIRGGSVLTSSQPVASQPSLPLENSYQQSYANNPVTPQFQQADEFDDFAAKFESTNVVKSTGNAFLDSLGVTAESSADAWGDTSPSNAFGDAPTNVFTETNTAGFGADDGFDNWNVPVAPESTPYANRKMSTGSNENISVTIRPKGDYDIGNVTAPALAPPLQKSPYSGSVYSEGKFSKLSLILY